MSITLILVVLAGLASAVGGWTLIIEGFKEREAFKIITGIFVLIVTWIFAVLSLQGKN